MDLIDTGEDEVKTRIFLKIIFGGHQSIIRLFWTSGDICPGWILHLCASSPVLHDSQHCSRAFLIQVVVHVQALVGLEPEIECTSNLQPPSRSLKIDCKREVA